MLASILFAIKQLLAIIAWQVHGLLTQRSGWLRRALVLLLATPLLVLLQIPNWIGLFSDRIFFPRSRKHPVSQPLFILGIPRSGTTMLQRTLSEDKQLTTTTLWDCIFAPSLTQKTLYKGLARFLTPVLRITNSNRLKSLPFLKTTMTKMNDIHSLGLNEAEEDFLFLFPLFSCFILIALFPENRAIWKLSNPALHLSAQDRKIVMAFYHSMVQKHLYYYSSPNDNRPKRYLSKNPSFTPWLKDLQIQFPDGHFIACIRTPDETIPSQISSLEPAFKLTGFNANTPLFKNFITQMLSEYYNKVLDEKSQINDQLTIVEMAQLKGDLFLFIQMLYRKVELSMTEELNQHYQVLAKTAEQYQSNHKYSADNYSENDKTTTTGFSGTWPYPAHLIFSPKQ